jgi:cysteine desulfuration protein SufE|tara:strand:+ start:338 stop:763 length:426 start_codon:yes stop_codon:yes gene_type:complete
MTILEKRDALKEDLSFLPDTEERFRYILDLGRGYAPLADELKTKDRLLPGCLSQLWLVPEFKDGICSFGMDADAHITKGIASMVCNLYNGETPESILSTDLEFLSELGIPQVLSANRRNGLSNLRHKIRSFAVASAAGASS